MSHTARVLLDVTPRTLARPLDYSVPEHLRGRVHIGSPVLVPLGSRHAVGYVVSFDPPETASPLKEIADVLGDPLFDRERWSLACWIADEYACRPIEALRLLLPPGSSPRVVKTRDGWRLRPPAASTVTERVVELLRTDHAPPPSARRQRAVIAALSDGPVALSELRASLGDVSDAVRALAAKGIVRITEQRRWRTGSSGLAREDLEHTLTPSQRAAVDAILRADPGSVVLVDGVTGSGKTEVYMHAVRAVLERGKQAVILVPEISLTPQTVGRFRSRFGPLLAVLHSRLSDGERYDQWQRVAAGEARLVIGARSALFAPAGDLGLIVIDEEHEPSYKQSSEPRYHARRVAREVARRAGAVLVLGSATPSIESLHAAHAGACTRVVLPKRAGSAQLPDVHVADMKKEFADGNRTMFSRVLAAQIEDALARRGKVILYINRRGFASFILCRECGYVPRCTRCSVSLTYHEDRSALTCHHCGHVERVPVACPRCSGPYLRRFGAGTQRVEAEAAARWPEAPIIRMDADTTRGKSGHERVLAAFEAMPSGILVGTQMVAKGLDYPDVVLVGVIDADTSMHLPDFRAAERTFQLLMQVSGRAGRAGRSGSVVIQTYWPDHPAVVAVTSSDREALIRAELEQRRSLRYPPFARLARLVVAAPSASAALREAEAIADTLRNHAPTSWEVLGPAEPAIARIKGMHRQHIVIKSPPDERLGPLVWKIVADRQPVSGVRVSIDVDPYEML